MVYHLWVISDNATGAYLWIELADVHPSISETFLHSRSLERWAVRQVPEQASDWRCWLPADLQVVHILVLWCFERAINRAL